MNSLKRLFQKILPSSTNLSQSQQQELLQDQCKYLREQTTSQMQSQEIKTSELETQLQKELGQSHKYDFDNMIEGSQNYSEVAGILCQKSGKQTDLFPDGSTGNIFQNNRKRDQKLFLKQTQRYDKNQQSSSEELFEEFDGEESINKNAEIGLITKSCEQIQSEDYDFETFKLQKLEEKKNQLLKKTSSTIIYRLTFCLVLNHSLKKVEDVNCTICLDYIIGCKIAICGHSFCEECLSEWLLRKKICPVCRKDIRKSKMHSFPQIDSIIKMMMTCKKDSEDLEELKRYEERVSKYNNWKQKTVVNQVKAGDQLDVRDTEYIWCVGTVELKIFAENHEPLLYIHYDGWNRKYDEYLYQQSTRIAPLGTYTSRTDIPRYRMCSHANMMHGHLVENDIRQQDEQQEADENELNEQDQQVEEEQAQEEEQNNNVQDGRNNDSSQIIFEIPENEIEIPFQVNDLFRSSSQRRQDRQQLNRSNEENQNDAERRRSLVVHRQQSNILNRSLSMIERIQNSQQNSQHQNRQQQQANQETEVQSNLMDHSSFNINENVNSMTTSEQQQQQQQQERQNMRQADSWNNNSDENDW